MLIVVHGGPAWAEEGIQCVQERLAALGKDPGPADGLIGPRTSLALGALITSTPERYDDGPALDEATAAEWCTRLTDWKPRLSAEELPSIIFGRTHIVTSDPAATAAGTVHPIVIDQNGVVVLVGSDGPPNVYSIQSGKMCLSRPSEPDSPEACAYVERLSGDEVHWEGTDLTWRYE